MQYTFNGFTFTFDLNSSGDVVGVTYPAIAALPSGYVGFNPAVPVNNVEAWAEGLVRILTGG